MCLPTAASVMVSGSASWLTVSSPAAKSLDHLSTGGVSEGGVDRIQIVYHTVKYCTRVGPHNRQVQEKGGRVSRMRLDRPRHLAGWGVSHLVLASVRLKAVRVERNERDAMTSARRSQEALGGRRGDRAAHARRRPCRPVEAEFDRAQSGEPVVPSIRDVLTSCLTHLVQPHDCAVVGGVTERLELVIPGLAESEAKLAVQFERVRSRRSPWRSGCGPRG